MADELCTTDDIASLRAEVLVARRATEETMRRLDALLARFPDAADLWVLRGKALLLNDPASVEARRNFEHALALNPTNQDAADAIGLRR